MNGRTFLLLLFAVGALAEEAWRDRQQQRRLDAAFAEIGATKQRRLAEIQGEHQQRLEHIHARSADDKAWIAELRQQVRDAAGQERGPFVLGTPWYEGMTHTAPDPMHRRLIDGWPSTDDTADK